MSDSAEVLDVTSNHFYTLEDNKIYKQEILNPQSKILVSGQAEVDTTMTNYMSVASAYSFFYASYKGENGNINYYLNMSDTSKFDNMNACESNFIGLFIGADKPVETYEEK